MRAQLRSNEDGFTLIELVIAMVLVSILLVVFASVLIKVFSGSSKAISERGVIDNVSNTMTMFSGDLRAAASPDRTEGLVPDQTQLSKALLQGAPVRGVLRNTTVTLDPRDVLEATATSFMMRSDVLPTAGVECVYYYVRPSDNALMRDVLAASFQSGSPAMRARSSV